MTWRAKLVSVNDPTVPTDEIIVNINYADEAGTAFTKQYNFHASSLSSALDLADFAFAEARKLASFYGAKASLDGFVGRDIAVSDPKENDVIRTEIKAAAEAKPIEIGEGESIGEVIP